VIRLADHNRQARQPDALERNHDRPSGGHLRRRGRPTGVAIATLHYRPAEPERVLSSLRSLLTRICWNDRRVERLVGGGIRRSRYRCPGRGKPGTRDLRRRRIARHRPEGGFASHSNGLSWLLDVPSSRVRCASRKHTPAPVRLCGRAPEPRFGTAVRTHRRPGRPASVRTPSRARRRGPQTQAEQRQPPRRHPLTVIDSGSLASRRHRIGRGCARRPARGRQPPVLLNLSRVHPRDAAEFDLRAARVRV
jgi:hypothetical protein